VDRETDGQTDITKLIVAFRNFANSPNKCLMLLVNLDAERHRHNRDDRVALNQTILGSPMNHSVVVSVR
jgi:hypothetical protein